MANNVQFNVFLMMIVQVRMAAIQKQVKRFVHQVGMEVNARFVGIRFQRAHYQVKSNDYVNHKEK